MSLLFILNDIRIMLCCQLAVALRDIPTVLYVSFEAVLLTGCSLLNVRCRIGTNRAHLTLSHSPHGFNSFTPLCFMLAIFLVTTIKALENLNYAYVSRDIGHYIDCFRNDLVFTSVSDDDTLNWGVDIEEYVHISMFNQVCKVDLTLNGYEEYLMER